MNFGTSWRSHLLGGAALAVMAAGLSAPANAQDAPAADENTGGLSEIVVTAQRRQENLQEVPIAVTAVTAESLAQTGVDTTRDLPQLIPSVQFTRSGASGLFFVRGVGTTNAAVGEEGANAVYVDGVYLADLAQTINNFNNIERVEVLKGPQGTLFGRNATGGLIHIITREPGDERVLKGEVGVSSYETISARVYAATPITDTISADIALTSTHQNRGWGANLTRNTKNKVQDFQGVRSKIVMRPAEGMKFTLSGDYFESTDNIAIGWRLGDGTIGTGGFRGPGVPGTPANAVVARDQDTTSNDSALTNLRVYGFGLTGEIDLGPATLTSITAYRNTRNISDFDVDAGPLPLIRIAFTSGGSSFQQELRLASNDTEPFSWQVGGFYLRAKANNNSFFSGAAFAPARGQQILADLKTDSYAVFGEATYSITPTTKLTGGIRYTKDTRNFDASQFTILASGLPAPGATSTIPSGRPLTTPGVQRSKLSYDKVTWRVALRQELTPDISVYASANKGFKSGSYSLQNPLNDPYLPQEIMAYEAGIKSELFDRRLRLNLSAFHYKIDDYQVRSAAVANPGSSLVLNAATVKVKGVEMEFEAAPTDNLRLFGGVTILDSKFDRFGGPGQAVQAPIVYPNSVNQPDPTDTRALNGPTGTFGVRPLALRGTRNPGVVGTGGLSGGYQTCLGDVSGNRTMNAPKFTATFGGTLTVPAGSGEVRVTGLYSYNSGYYFEPDNIALQGAINLVNASIEYRPVENFGVEIWGRNLTDTEYAVQKITTGTGVAQTNGPPRTWGVNFKFDF